MKMMMTTLTSTLLLLLLMLLTASRTDGRSMVDKFSPVFHEEVRLIVDEDDDDKNDDDEGTSNRAGGMSSQQIQEIVDHHNALRAGEGASNMETMRWNGQLAQLAQTWSDRCEFEHGQPQFDAAAVGYEHLGQNLYVNSDLSAGLRAGVQAWFDEKTDYSYDAVSCAPGRACGHYTQVVWATSKEVGCGLTKCGSIAGMKNANYLVCNYGPPGNWQGQKPFKKGAACSACDSGKFFCSNNLCDSSCSSAGQGSTCRCMAQCGKCGTQTKDCKCECQPGWTGVACNEECRDKHKYCGGNPGWSSSWCDSSHQYVLDNCPALCKLCQAATGAGQSCGGRSWRDANNTDISDDSSQRRQQQQEQELVDAVNKLQQKLMKLRAE